ncbi:MAG: DegV family protein [bacterium]
MEKIGLLLDSTAITRDDIRSYPFIKIASLGVTIDGVDYQETAIPQAQMISFIHTAKKMSTSQPAPGDFLRLFEEYHAEGYTHVLVVVLSDKISGTFQSAVIAKTMVDFPLQIEILSPQVASFGVALGIPPLAQMIVNGKSFKKIVERARSLYADAKVMFTLADLMHLFRGGRLNRISALIGTVLRIKPIIEMIDGKLQLTKRERTNQACFQYFLETIDRYREKHSQVAVDVIHMNRAEWADRLVDAITKKYPDIEIHRTIYISPVFYVHLGDQGFGIALTGE